jgi:hypothetical protein
MLKNLSDSVLSSERVKSEYGSACRHTGATQVAILNCLDFCAARSDDHAPVMRNTFALFVLLSALGAKAATVTYTFESPEFAEYETTPLLNRAPQIGSPGFHADFTTFPSVNGLTITTLGPSPFFSGQCLLDGYPPPGADTLRITLNTPVSSVQVDFALFAPDHLQFTSSAGSISAPVLPSTQWGTLTFTSAIPFTQFDLQGFDPSNQPTQLAIDNLIMTVVPEPSAIALFSLSLLALQTIVGRRGPRGERTERSDEPERRGN